LVSGEKKAKQEPEVVKTGDKKPLQIGEVQEAMKMNDYLNSNR
jgi:hypothetical protein